MLTPMNSERLLTPGQLADLLSLPVSWVYTHTRGRATDRLPGYRLGKYWRFKESEVLRWLEDRRMGARPNA